MNHHSEYFSGQGKVFIAEYKDGVKGAYRFVGNVPSLSLETSVEKIKHKESYSGTRSFDKVITADQNVAVNFTLEEVGIENLALAFSGIVKQSQENQITNEPSPDTITKGDNWVLKNQKVKDVVIVDSQDQPLVENTDYAVDLVFGRITYLSDSQTLKPPFKVSYTAGVVQTVSFLQKDTEYALRFEGLNTAENNKPVLVNIERMSIEPASTFELINDELNQFEMSGNVLMTNSELITITKL